MYEINGVENITSQCKFDKYVFQSERIYLFVRMNREGFKIVEKSIFASP